MKLGEIYYWETDRVSGYQTRFKYHVYIGTGDWRIEGNVFLFINKSDYGNDLKITKEEYKFFPRDYCYVGCGSIVSYTDEKIKAAAPDYRGNLSSAHLTQIYNIVAASDTLTGYEIKYLCGALKAFA